MNFRLVLGVLLTVALIVVAIAGPAVAPYDKDYSEKIIIQKANGRIAEMEFPPRPPSREHPFGTDRWGYDILSSMLYGARYTLGAAFGVAALRLLLAGLVGSGLGLKSLGREGSALGALGGIPGFLVVYFVVYSVTLNSPLSVGGLFALQVAVMVLVGVPGLVSVIEERVGDLRRADHVQAAASLGARSPRLLGRHILPFLRHELGVLLVAETVLALNLIGQLGVFNLFLGGTIYQRDPDVFLSRTSEWSGLLGQARIAVLSAPWIVVFPLLGFLAAILALFLLTRGLEIRRRRSGLHGTGTGREV